MPPLQKFKKRHKTLHRVIAYLFIVGIFWGGWRVFDTLSGEGSPGHLLSGVLVIIASLAFLYFDDFRLNELK